MNCPYYQGTSQLIVDRDLRENGGPGLWVFISATTAALPPGLELSNPENEIHKHYKYTSEITRDGGHPEGEVLEVLERQEVLLGNDVLH